MTKKYMYNTQDFEPNNNNEKQVTSYGVTLKINPSSNKFEYDCYNLATKESHFEANLLGIYQDITFTGFVNFPTWTAHKLAVKIYNPKLDCYYFVNLDYSKWNNGSQPAILALLESQINSHIHLFAKTEPGLDMNNKQIYKADGTVQLNGTICLKINKEWAKVSKFAKGFRPEGEKYTDPKDGKEKTNSNKRTMWLFIQAYYYALANKIGTIQKLTDQGAKYSPASIEDLDHIISQSINLTKEMKESYLKDKKNFNNYLITDLDRLKTGAIDISGMEITQSSEPTQTIVASNEDESYSLGDFADDFGITAPF